MSTTMHRERKKGKTALSRCQIRVNLDSEKIRLAAKRNQEIASHAREKWYVRRKPSRVSKSAGVHDRFQRLAYQWLSETEFSSDIGQITAHPAYLQIIALGPEVIPYVLRQLKCELGHWFIALRALAQGDDPGSKQKTMVDARNAWLEWGTEQGYID